MLGHLSIRTRQIVEQLLQGKTAILGGSSIGPFSAPQQAFLQLAASNVGTLAELRGTDLLSAVSALYDHIPEFVSTNAVEELATAHMRRWKIGRIRTRSFRGIAPASCDWEYDFGTKSHLLYGPNGCGKSSLLGAICWCLTGRLFRDDGPPSQPEAIRVYSTSRKPKQEGTRPDALTLLGSDGATSSATEHYFVELELVSSDALPLTKWIRRHSKHELASSDDGCSWTVIDDLSAVGLSGLDIELHILMPARVGHLRFGKDNGVLNLFSQLVGLDDLETIADIAGRCHKDMVREANALEKNGRKPCRETISQTVLRLEQTTPQHVTNLVHYAAAVAPSRTLGSISSLSDEIGQRLAAAKAQLAFDLGITVPEPEEPDAAKMIEQLNLLPGHIDTAVTALAHSVSQLMRSSLGRPVQTPKALGTTQENLESFSKTARERVMQRLDWALSEQKSAKSSLMLMAAEHLSPGESACPVCTQELPRGSAVLAQLEALKPLTGKPHLKQSLADLENALIAELDLIVSRQQRQDTRLTLGETLLQDWNALKEARFLGLVRRIADQFDEKIVEALRLIPASPLTITDPLAGTFAEQFSHAFTTLDEELARARNALQFEHDLATYYAALTSSVTAALGQGQMGLHGLLLRGKDSNQQIKDLLSAQSLVASVLTQQQKADALTSQIALLQERANATDATKALGDSVRKETIDVVKGVEPIMKEYYERLYDSEHLIFDMVTTGNATNPHVKDEFNIYLRAGNTRLPASPFANAGRLRAIALCFIFALQHKAIGTLGAIVLDDPALSLDDEHKARFVDHLVTPKLTNHQVILATHYESFFKCAVPCFAGAERLELAPRRRVEDVIVFDPTDLLQRVDDALAKHSSAWREVGIDLRRWTERTLGTLSGYCPLPFAAFNDIPQSINNYERITDVRVATKRRDKIVVTLRAPQFTRVMHKLAHDEEVTKPDVIDGLAKLKECRKESETEIERFRELFKHELLKRRISARPIVSILSVNAKVPPIDLPVNGRAAAASNGVGITWIDTETLNLSHYQVALVREDVLAPIALIGQYVVLDCVERVPTDGDLVAATAHKEKTYIRRFWRQNGLVILEATNPTTPINPVTVPADQCEARRIVGVLFDGASCNRGGIADEWAVPGNLREAQFGGVFGIRVDGTSLEPIARDGQIVLAREVKSFSEISNGALACFDLQDIGAVLKRCYSVGNKWVLCPVNPVEVEDPILVESSSVLHAYRLVGVLFEPAVSENLSGG